MLVIIIMNIFMITITMIRMNRRFTNVYAIIPQTIWQVGCDLHLYHRLLVSSLPPHTPTLTVPCPEQFQWQKNINKCYSVWLDRVPGTEIVNACKILHPKATPVEPRSKVQMDLIERLVGK